MVQFGALGGVALLVVVGGVMGLRNDAPPTETAAAALPEAEQQRAAAPPAPAVAIAGQRTARGPGAAPSSPAPAAGSSERQQTGPRERPPRSIGRDGLPGLAEFGGNSLGDRRDSSAVDARPAPGWKVEPDSASYDTTVPADRKVEIPLPEAGVLFPTVPGTAVALGSNTFERNRREVWDMAAGKKIGTIRGVSIRMPAEALSPDGRYYAAKPRGVDAIGIVDVANEKVLGQVPVTATWFYHLGFSSPTRLVAIYDESVQVWDLPELAPTLAFAPQGLGTGSKYALSPGGRYLAIGTSLSDSELRIYDLNDGTLAGERAASEFGCDALAFSPDGSELAGVFSFGLNAELIVWDVRTGRARQQIDLRSSLSDALPGGGAHYDGRPLEWFPDGKRWLVYGHVVVDRDAGGVVWVLPKDAGSGFSTTPRAIIGENRVAVVMPGGKTGRLAAYALPEDQIARTVETTRAGGLGIDVHLPPLTPADVRSAAIVEASNRASTTPSQVQTGPGPNPPAGLLPEPLTLENPGGRFAAARLAGGAQPAAVVSFSNFDAFGKIGPAQPARTTAPKGRGALRKGVRGEQQEAPEQRPTAAFLQRYDLVTGQQSGSIRIPFPSELLAVSPSGDLALMQIAGLGTRAEGKGRLDIWSFTDGGHVAAWRPYRELDDKGNGEETFEALFVDEEHLITRNFWGKTVCWKLPECQAVWILESGKGLSLSPDGKVLALLDIGTIRFLEPVSGAIIGEFSPGNTVYALAWNRDGRRMAVVTNASGAVSLVVLDVQRGTIEQEIPIPDGGQSLEWCGDQALLIDNRLYCDLEQQAILWEYELPVGVHIPGSIDNRHWYIAAYSDQDSRAMLNAVELPGAHLAAKLARMKPEDTVLGPGTTVSVQVNVTGGPANLSQEGRKSLIERLQKAGIRAADGQPVTISLTAAQSSTGKTRNYESSGLEKDIRKVDVNKVECRVAVSFQGRTLWEHTNTLTNNEILVTGVKPENLQSYVDEQMWQRAAEAVKDARVPKYVFRESTPTGLGKSQFLPGGLASAAR